MGNFSFSVKIGGKQRWLLFCGAKADEGYYSTANRAEQEAIESSTRFKMGGIRLESSYEVKMACEEGGCSEPVSNENKEVITEVQGITTVQQAREWLLGSCDVKASELSNKEAVLEYATAHSIVFTDMK